MNAEGRRAPVDQKMMRAVRSRSLDTLARSVTPDGSGGFTAASGVQEGSDRSMYPQAWAWDTFIVAAWTEDVDQGIRDVKKYLASQLPNGRIAHMRYPRVALEDPKNYPSAEIYYEGKIPETREVTSRLTQPPVEAWGVMQLARKIEDPTKRKEFLTEVFPQLMDYHKYLYGSLTYENLLVTIHPWQNGDDNSPKWDRVIEKVENTIDTHVAASEWFGRMGLPYARRDTDIVNPNERPTDNHDDFYHALLRVYADWGWDEATILKHSPFRIGDPLNNAILLRSNFELLDIAHELGEKDSVNTIRGWINTTQTGLKSLWEEEDGMYYAKDLTDGNLIRVKTISSLMPLFSQGIPGENADRLATHILDLKRQHPDMYLIPSVFPDEGEFDPNKYWRGPIWLFLDKMVADGLERYGHWELADEIMEDVVRLAAMSLNEFQHPKTGEGQGADNQSWTAAAALEAIRSLRVRDQ